MTLKGLKVKHNIWGIGTVLDLTGNCLSIEFSIGVKKLVYPDAFAKFIKAEDPTVQAAILQIIKDAQEAEEQRKHEEEAARKAEAERQAAAQAARRAEIAKKTNYTPKPVARSYRVEGKRMTFFVFQGDTFEKELRGGYIWAPIYDKEGSSPHHWTRLLDVRKGDIILHGCNGYVQAISVAHDACYACNQPEELVVEDLWEREGRRVDCDYFLLTNPVKTSDFRSDILRLCYVKYSPFDKNGNGNMGYLFEINRELARIFIEAGVKHNPRLGAVDYIDEFLAEDSYD